MATLDVGDRVNDQDSGQTPVNSANEDMSRGAGNASMPHDDVIPELQPAPDVTNAEKPSSRPTTSRSDKRVQIAPSTMDYDQDKRPQGPISDARAPSTSGSVEPSPEERVKALLNAYSPRRSLSARSSHCSPRPLDTARKRDGNVSTVAAHEGMLNDERKKVMDSYVQTVTKLAGVFNEERKKSEAKAKEKVVLMETLRDLSSSTVVPAAMQGSAEQATIADLKERVESLTLELEATTKESRMCEHMAARTRLSARKRELKIKHLKVLHDRVAMDRDQAELNMIKAQDERLSAENRVFQLEAELEEQRARNPQALAGLRRVCEKRQEMLLQRSLWENRVQTDIEAIQRGEREKALRAKLVINSLHSVRARQTHQSVKEKAEDFEERLKHVEQSTGLRIDLRNVGDVVDLVIRQRKLKDLQLDKVRGEARREALAEEVRELHAALWSLMNVPERSSKMLDELNGPLRRAETRAEKAGREVQANTMLALKLKSWLRNLTEKLATVDMLVGNDRRNSQEAPPAPAGPPVTLTMPDEDLIRAIELLENRVYRCLLIASAPADASPGEPPRDPKTPRAARQSIFPTPLTSPRTANPSSPLKSPVISPLSSFARLFDPTNPGKLVEPPTPAQPEESSQTAGSTFDPKASVRTAGTLLASIVESASSSGRESIAESGAETTRTALGSSGPVPVEQERKPEASTSKASSTGKLRATVRPKLAAITSLLRPRTASMGGSNSATSRSADPPRGRPPTTAAGKFSKTWAPRGASNPENSASEENPQLLTASSLPSARVPKLALKQKSDASKPRVTLEVNLLGGSELPGRTPREGESVGSTSFRRRPASAHPLMQAATNQLQTLKPEQLEALVLGQSTPRDVALDLLSRPGGNNWRLDQKIRNLRECFMTGPNAEDANGGPAAVARSRSARSTVVPKMLDDDKEVILERADIKQQSAKILDLLRVAEKKWEEDERRLGESVREAALLMEKEQAAQRIQRLARRK